MKLAAKFARQETEEARVARVARRRIPSDRIDAIRRMLDLPETRSQMPKRRRDVNSDAALICPECKRAFSLPMHLGRHKKARHDPTVDEAKTISVRRTRVLLVLSEAARI